MPAIAPTSRKASGGDVGNDVGKDVDGNVEGNLGSPAMQSCGVDIKVSTQYLKQQSDPGRAAYAFAYTITITNNREQPVKLLSRHWIITDQNNKVEEVKGSGVVGQQPLIQPGQSYQYSSGAVIHTEIGDMTGTYTMQSSNGDLFAAPIPLFILAVPHMLH